MAIRHLSVSVDHPQRAAHSLAEIWGGRAFPFYPHSGAWIAFSPGEPSSQIEFYPAGMEIKPDDSSQGHAIGYNPSASALTPTHIAITTDHDRTTVETIAAREGWRCRIGDRGGEFETLDFWVDNRLMIEVLTPDLQPSFNAALTASHFDEVTSRGQ